MTANDPKDDPACHAASTTLRRLVSFVAAAFDARYAFVAGLAGREGGLGTRRASLWLARDYGLSPALERLDDLAVEPACVARGDYLALLRGLWPHDPALARVTTTSCLSVPLLDPEGRLLGHLGLVESGQVFRLYGKERLRPLARLAAAELRTWAETVLPRE
jgi:hypothetical protein